MGRITPSFRQLYHGQIEDLRRRSGFQDTLLDLENRKALDSLIKEAWSPEGAAMAQANIPAVLDAMNLMANVHNKKTSEALRKRVEELEKHLEDLSPEDARKTLEEKTERPAVEEAPLPVPSMTRYGPNRRRKAQRRLRPVEVQGDGTQALLQKPRVARRPLALEPETLSPRDPWRPLGQAQPKGG